MGRWGLVGAAALAMACGGGGSDDASTVNLSGSVNKGPFVLGSSVSVSPLNDEGEPTGQVFSTETSNDLGDFSVAVQHVGPVRLEGDGFFFVENSGLLSGSQITLRGFHHLDDEEAQNAYLNLITHLSFQRVAALVADGDDVEEATAQAEGELRVGLGVALGAEPDRPGIEMNLDGDNPGNAYLLAVSSLLIAASGGGDAYFQQLINTIAADLAEDGIIDEATRSTVQEYERSLDAETIMANLAARFEEFDSTREVPDLHTVLDSDGDGIANASDDCPYDDDHLIDADNDGDPCDICDASGCEVPDPDECADDSELESNDTLPTATATGVPAQTSMRLVGLAICPVSDVDLFAFATPAGGISTISASVEFHGDVPPVLELLDDSGAVVSQGAVTLPETLSLTVTGAPASEDFYVRVSSAGVAESKQYNLNLLVTQ